MDTDGIDEVDIENGDAIDDIKDEDDNDNQNDDNDDDDNEALSFMEK